MAYSKTHRFGYLIGSYYLSPKESDLTLVVNGNRIFAHKLVMSRQSIVFKKMLFGDFKESNDKEIEIKDTDVDSIHTLLKYCYGEDLTPEDWSKDYVSVIDVLKCAHLYQIRFLCLICELKLVGQMSVHNVVQLLEFAVLYQLKRVKCFAQIFVKHYGKDIITSEEFLNCKSLEVLKIMIKRIRFNTQLEAIKTFVSIIERNNGWNLKDFIEFIEVEKLSIDDMNYIRNHDSIAFPEIAIKRIQDLEEMVSELRQQNNELSTRLPPTAALPHHIIDDWGEDWGEAVPYVDDDPFADNWGNWG